MKTTLPYKNPIRCKKLCKFHYQLKRLSIFLFSFFFFHSVSCQTFLSEGLWYEITGSNTVSALVRSDPPDSYCPVGDITIPDTVSYLGTTYRVTDIFGNSNCTRLTSVNILSKYITSLDYRDFAFAINLKWVNIPSSLLDLNNNDIFYIFPWCVSLSSINVDPNNPRYSSIDGVVFNKAQDTLLFCPMRKTGDYQIPEGVVHINDLAFYNIDTISVHIPSSVVSIGYGAFWMESLNSIHVNNCTPPVCLGDPFLFNIAETCKLYVPPGCDSAYKQAPFWQDFYKCNISVLSEPPEGGNVSGSGRYFKDDTINITAEANPGFRFRYWKKGNDSVNNLAEYRFPPTQSDTFTAVFEVKKFEIEVLVSPPAGGSITGSGMYDTGSVVQLQAVPQTGYVFKEWQENGTAVSTDAIYSFEVSQNRTLTAVFELKKFTIDALAMPSVGGVANGSGNYDTGAVVHLQAIPKEDYAFRGWQENGTVVSTAEEYSFPATQSRSLTALFVRQVTISARVEPATAGTVIGEGIYDAGSTVRLQAVVNTGYEFLGWYEGANRISTQTLYEFAAQNNRTFRAVFVLRCTIELSYQTMELQTGDTVHLQAITVPGYIARELVWKSSHSEIATVDSTGKVTALKAGTTVITVANRGGNCQAACQIAVIADKGLQVYPNPVINGQLKIESGKLNSPTASSLRGTKQSVELYDLQGRPAASFAITEERTELNVSHLPSGTYVLKIGDNIWKITIQN